MTSTAHRRTSGLEEFDGEQWYTVVDVDHMAPFLMSLVSDGDCWMFVSSSGALTAGRGNATHALFPYVTDDRLHASAGRVGPVTRLRVGQDRQDGQDEILWVPFEERPAAGTRRFLSKSVVGDSVVFEEHRPDLGLRFRCRWSTSATHGFVRTTTVQNVGSEPVRVAVLDGLVDLLPYGIDPTLYQRLSNLANAYKRSELVDQRLAVYSLETPVSDQAEPEEVLRATVVWSSGLDGSVTLDERAIERFEASEDLTSALVTGRPGAYLLRGDVEIEPGTSTSWQIVADVGSTQSDVVELRDELRTSEAATAVVDETHRTGERLAEIMAMADAAQLSGDPVSCAHHYANVTYNVMRGGVPLDGYRIDVDDLVDFVGAHNREVAARHADFLASLPERIERRDLLARVSTTVAQTGDVHLGRLVEQYLPFSFSRRHGDPSRPWNQFSIRVVDDAGAPVVYFEGNWRDLFQNWEALCASFPEYLPGVVALFVNASTADGYNPYRVTRNGIDWEVPDPDDPWSNIGYWGDHQIVYLLRLLEATEQYLPGEIARRLDQATHTYADVPYRIAAYDDLVRDPKSTIEFDEDAHAASEVRVERLGADGKLLADADGELVVVTLLEKLLVPALAKLSNFVPGGGIWMNTQRPEWNDANNALVGNGLSMVTLFHLRRYLDHLRSLVDQHGRGASVSVEVVSWFDALREILTGVPAVMDAETDADADRRRRDLMDRLGRAASDHRSRIDGAGLSGTFGEIARRRSHRLVHLRDRAPRRDDPDRRAIRRARALLQHPPLPDPADRHRRAAPRDARRPGRGARLGRVVRSSTGRPPRRPVRERSPARGPRHVPAGAPSPTGGVPRQERRRRRGREQERAVEPAARCRESHGDPDRPRRDVSVRPRPHDGTGAPGPARTARRGRAVGCARCRRTRRRARHLRVGLLPPGLHRPVGFDVRLRGHRFGLLAHGDQAVARGPGGPRRCGATWRRRGRRRAPSRCLLAGACRTRGEHVRRAVRRHSDRPVLAQPGARRRPAAGDDRCREGGDPDAATRARPGRGRRPRRVRHAARAPGGTARRADRVGRLGRRRSDGGGAVAGALGRVDALPGPRRGHHRRRWLPRRGRLRRWPHRAT